MEEYIAYKGDKYTIEWYFTEKESLNHLSSSMGFLLVNSRNCFIS